MARSDLLTTEARRKSAAEPAPAGDGYVCPLCAHRFSSEELACHHGCPLSRHCQVICCPNCCYESVDTAQMEARVRRWSSLLRRIFRRAA